ncbi:MAG: sulfite exporter TauE/SafE family protein [Parachlamydia sp.]|nr:sulfite exporter TauE/SafE family protein [Parachlamydia sp.]
MELFLEFLIIGFLAQLVDGALGMAYGLTSTTLLLSTGLSPAYASFTTHAAECITSGFSGLSHHQFGNVDGKLFRRLLLPGILGAIVGSFLLTMIDSHKIKPFVALYLLIMGAIIVIKAFREFPPRSVTTHLIPLGFTGAFMDSVGGGGWGPIVTSTLLVRGNDARMTIGSVNACEFFIAVASSLTFLAGGVDIGWQVVAALAIGGAIAAPIGAWLCKHIPTKWLMMIVGTLIVGLSCRTFWLSFNG